MTGALALRPVGPRAVRADRPPRSRARRPDWWLPAVASAGWAVLVLAEAARAVAADPPGGGHTHAGPAATGGVLHPVVEGVLHHGVLALAMVAIMLPLIAPNVRYAALRSPRAARGGVTRAVVTGWSSVWLLAATAVGAAGVLLAHAGGPAALLAATALAAAWQWSRIKRRSVARCHRVVALPLAPAAARTAGRAFGRALGRDCAGACLPLMLMMAVSAHALVVTAAVAWVAWYERRRRPHHDPAPGRTAAVLAAAGGLGTALAAVGPG